MLGADLYIKKTLLSSNYDITPKLFDDHYRKFKPVLDEIKHSDINIYLDAARVTEQMKHYKSYTFHYNKETSIVSVIKDGICNPAVSSFEKSVESITNPKFVDKKLVSLRGRVKKDLDELSEKAEEYVNFGESSSDIKIGECSEFERIVVEIADFYGAEGYTAIAKIQAFSGINECLTCLVVEHKICMIVGSACFFSHIFHKIHMDGNFDYLVGAVEHKMYHKYKALKSLSINKFQDYKSELSAVARTVASLSAAGALSRAPKVQISTSTPDLNISSVIVYFFKGLAVNAVNSISDFYYKTQSSFYASLFGTTTEKSYVAFDDSDKKNK